MPIDTYFVEKDLRIDLINVFADPINFDDSGGKNHGMTHCMKPVDFIFETNDYYYFVEFKDPDHPRAGAAQIAIFVQEVENGTIKNELVKKFRDTFLYRYAQEKLEKPVKYCVLLCCKHINPAGYMKLQEEMRRELPINKASSWTRKLVDNCVVLNIIDWNENFPDWTVTRLSIP